MREERAGLSESRNVGIYHNNKDGPETCRSLRSLRPWRAAHGTCLGHLHDVLQIRERKRFGGVTREELRCIVPMTCCPALSPHLLPVRPSLQIIRWQRAPPEALLRLYNHRNHLHLHRSGFNGENSDVNEVAMTHTHSHFFLKLR